MPTFRRPPCGNAPWIRRRSRAAYPKKPPRSRSTGRPGSNSSFTHRRITAPKRTGWETGRAVVLASNSSRTEVGSSRGVGRATENSGTRVFHSSSFSREKVELGLTAAAGGPLCKASTARREGGWVEKVRGPSAGLTALAARAPRGSDGPASSSSCSPPPRRCSD